MEGERNRYSTGSKVSKIHEMNNPQGILRKQKGESKEGIMIIPKKAGYDTQTPSHWGPVR